ncbi:SDR family NAD(P)-dependent oxidoreductase [Bacillus chungangensis]|uniref:NAD(P)-dependent dehydrogenase (Short-subunit alcohol dehydrogenase family) n=1 Tax=Bacillus chungangensis TaxID=587633 RepID=A0ABT9WV23_9BACI|nr:SDR family NAD(P)-dependent oxidoreductase [Bacillus chungangensis]MDQ0177057.1 NAD(P)-dependent dehydrogenase (short-subunit alcohol dehydrogenase family) [Bacillus chungangensis]
MKRLDNKVAIVTGAGGGMGKAEALLFAKEGAKVVVTDVQEDKVKEVVAEIKALGSDALGFYQDVTSEETWSQIVKKTVDVFGKIDILVNNAGVSGDETPMHEITLEKWSQIMDINLKGTFLGMKHVVPYMKENGGGSIVNISSIAGLTGMSKGGPYTASKGGVRMISKGAAIEYAKDNIRVNSVHPGVIETPMTKALLENEQYAQWFASITPIGRLGKAEDVAEGVLYLASDESSFVTGVELPIDGGFTAQ